MKNQIGIFKSTALLRWTVEKERLVDDLNSGHAVGAARTTFPLCKRP
jgi:hypothetical protein